MLLYETYQTTNTIRSGVLLDDSGPSQSIATSLVAVENTLILYGGASDSESTMQFSLQYESDISFTILQTVRATFGNTT